MNDVPSLPSVPGEPPPLDTRRIPSPPEPIDTPERDVITLEVAKAERARELHYRLAHRNRLLSLGLPLLLAILALLFAFTDAISALMFPEYLGYLLAEYDSSGLSRILIVWFFPLVIVVTYYYFAIGFQIRIARNELRDLEEQLYLKRFATHGWSIHFLREELVKLTNKTARVFFGNQERYEQAIRWHKEAVDILNSLETEQQVETMSDSIPVNVDEVQFRLGLINELILREEREQQEQRTWQYMALLIMVVYIVGLIVATMFTDATKSNQPIPIFGIPISVAMWGATGSLAAILYRFYTEQSRIRLASEVRWLIARPIIGIIMGAVVYSALVSGLILLGATPIAADQEPNTARPIGRMEIYWIIAFLAGFSDKFYIGIINLLVEKTFRVEEEPRKDGPKQ